MKKGEVELKVASGSCGMNDYFIEQINGNPFTIFNLQDLRDLIDTVLGEKKCTHCRDCGCSEDSIMDSCRGECYCHHQPLTEGEGEHERGII